MFVSSLDLQKLCVSGGKAKKVKVVQHKLSIILLVRKAGASVFVCNS